MMRKILVPIDFSEPSRTALRDASELAKATDAELLLLFVDEFPRGTATELPYLPSHVVTEHTEAVRSELAAALAEVQDRGCRARTCVVPGSAYNGILAAIDEEKPDLVVMGTHGRSGVHRLVLGSVAERIARTSPVPVLAVRHAERPTRTAPG